MLFSFWSLCQFNFQTQSETLRGSMKDFFSSTMLGDNLSITGCAILSVRNTNWRQKTVSSWTRPHRNMWHAHTSGQPSALRMSHSKAHLVSQLSMQFQITLIPLLHNSQAESLPTPTSTSKLQVFFKVRYQIFHIS